MFSDPLPDDQDYRVYSNTYADNHYLKQFAKRYKGRRWIATMDSIYQDIKRIHADKMQKGQQVDQILCANGYWLLKYRFTVAQTKLSPKKSGNRAVVLLDSKTHHAEILMLYHETNFPKNIGETAHIMNVIKHELPDKWALLH